MFQAAFVLVGILLLDFGLLHLSGSAPAAIGAGRPPTLAEQEQVRKIYGLDRPLIPRFLDWIGDVVRGDLKTSLVHHRRVTDMIAEALPATLLLQSAAVLLMFAVGIPLGVIAARRKRRTADRIITSGTLFAYSIPDYWLATLLLLFFATDAGIEVFPYGRLHSHDAEALATWPWLWDLLRHMVLPVTVLAVPGIAVISRHVRRSMITALAMDSIRTARAAGLTEQRIVWKYALKNALVPVATLVGALVPSLIGGSVIIEQIFDIYGMGRLLWQSTFEHDYPVLQALFLLTATLTLAGYLLGDVLTAIVSPRVRLS